MSQTEFTPVRSESLYSGIALFACLFFCLAGTTVAGVWISKGADYLNQGHPALSPDFVFAAFVSVIFTILTIAAAVTSMTVLWGQKDYYTGTAALRLGEHSGVTPATVSITSLFGVTLIREYFSKWQEIPTEDYPVLPHEQLWSHLAFDNLHVSGSDTHSAHILEAAIWQLIALGIVTLSVRKESKQFLRFWIAQNTLSSYGAPCPHASPAPTTYWEQKLYHAIAQKSEPVSMFDWVVDAFGASVSNVPIEIQKPICKEYESRGLGKRTGLLKSTFVYADASYPASTAPQWKLITDYIHSHDRNGLRISHSIEQAVRKAMKNRESSD